MDDDERELYRLNLKRAMLEALGTGTCTMKPRESREEVLELIRAGDADILMSTASSSTPMQHFAVHFTDRELALAAREDSLDLYGLRVAQSSSSLISESSSEVNSSEEKM